ncbi:hypothetical protein [Burkholderia sp. HI2714]|uniref:hypothetical protein n=1 Tax=Burkholderia sp. HI2714 TaxID=2015359 RepID=UPI0011806B3C|nr:hypothetical protein [Burkholderia sp. HI2714]
MSRQVLPLGATRSQQRGSDSARHIGHAQTVEIDSDLSSKKIAPLLSMFRATADIAHDIATFVPEDGNWLALDLLVTELWQAGHPEQAIPALLSVFERYPEEDGFGVIWGVLHGLESLPNYEQELLRSIARQPSEFGVCMVGRLLNAGIEEVGGISLLDTLHQLAATTKSPRIREAAAGFASRNN